MSADYCVRLTKERRFRYIVETHGDFGSVNFGDVPYGLYLCDKDLNFVYAAPFQQDLMYYYCYYDDMGLLNQLQYVPTTTPLHFSPMLLLLTHMVLTGDMPKDMLERYVRQFTGFRTPDMQKGLMAGRHAAHILFMGMETMAHWLLARSRARRRLLRRRSIKRFSRATQALHTMLLSLSLGDHETARWLCHTSGPFRKAVEQRVYGKGPLCPITEERKNTNGSELHHIYTLYLLMNMNAVNAMLELVDDPECRPLLQMALETSANKPPFNDDMLLLNPIEVDGGDVVLRHVLMANGHVKHALARTLLTHKLSIIREAIHE